MFIGVLEVLGLLFYWTWFVWPFVFMFGLGYGIKEITKTGEIYNLGMLAAAAALLVMLAGILAPSLV